MRVFFLRFVAETAVTDHVDATAVFAVVTVTANLDTAPFLRLRVNVLAVGLLALQLA
jgi:hypothetical protein